MITDAYRKMQKSTVFSLLVLTVLVSQRTSSSTEREREPSVATTLDSFQVHGDFSIRAVAHEPLVLDPISAKLDPFGRLWVIEMPDYPTGPPETESPIGRLKVLLDKNGDGVFDTASIFASKLDFPTGVQPYRTGAIVTVAGEILFIQDDDGDLIGDQQTVWFEGFAEQNQQLRANHPTLAPNGLVYVANGLRGGKVQAVDGRFNQKPNPIDLSDGDFFFDPEGGDWGVVTGKSQFGLTIDDYGRRIGCSNRNPAMHAALGSAIIARNPLLSPRDAVVDVSLAGSESEVFGRGVAWTTSNLHGGQFSAACGVFAPGWYSGSQESLFVCEPTAYLVQRQILEETGSVWKARRTSNTFDFITSDSEWFRPVDLTSGTANSLLIVDMARAVIEHPDFMPPELKNRPDQRDGTHLGRIWQVAESGLASQKTESINSDNAAHWLVDESPWKRISATQYFLERGSKFSGQWESILQDSKARPSGRARAAFLLKRHGRLTLDHIKQMINSGDHRLRALGVSFSVSCDLWPENLPELLMDPSSSVLFELAKAFADTEMVASDVRIQSLATIASSSFADTLVKQVIGSIPKERLLPLANILARQQDKNIDVLEHLTERIAIESPQDAIGLLQAFFERQRIPNNDAGYGLPLVFAWYRGTTRGRHSIQQIIGALDKDESDSFLLNCNVVNKTLLREDASPVVRARCLQLLLSLKSLDINLRTFVSDDHVTEIRSVAIKQLLATDSDWIRSYLSDHWLTLQSRLRQEVIQSCVSRGQDSLWLLNEVKKDRLPRNAIDPRTVQRLQQSSNSEVASLAVEILAPNQDRRRVISQYQDALADKGNPDQGKQLFSVHCAACHQVDGIGTNVGPDISDTRTKTEDYLLVSILDPNAAIDASFVQVQILTIDGLTFEGLLLDENNKEVTIQQQGGERRVILKTEIEVFKSPGISLMPEGFERTINPSQMRDLIAYLKNWRYMSVRIPGVSPSSN